MLIDTHVHLYSCHNVDIMLNAAITHFNTYNKDDFGVLMLTETVRDHAFEALHDGLLLQGTSDWSVVQTNEAESCLLQHSKNGELIVIAGRQIITHERLEVLALATTATFENGQPIREVIEQVRELGGYVVLPWAVGKWLGKRGHIVRHLIDDDELNIAVSDNGNRCRWTPKPALLKRAAAKNRTILAGSDPLPLTNHQTRAGSYGSVLDLTINRQSPAADIRRKLSVTQNDYTTFGQPVGPVNFLSSQTRLRLPH